jgi:hypothetical protein
MAVQVRQAIQWITLRSLFTIQPQGSR